jgi:hypothetical protein
MSKTPPAAANISRDDLERKLRAFQGDIKGKVDDQKSNLMAAGAGVGALMLILFFLLGRRSGKKKSTVVEIRRL